MRAVGITYRIDNGPWNRVQRESDHRSIGTTVVLILMRTDRPWTSSVIDYAPWIQIPSGIVESDRINSSRWAAPSYTILEHSARLKGPLSLLWVSYNETSDETRVEGSGNILVAPSARPALDVGSAFALHLYLSFFGSL